MAASYGKIVSLSSVSGRRGRPLQTHYAASKAAIISLTQSVALALAPYRINANAVCPGIVPTPMWQQIDKDRGQLFGAKPGEAMAGFINTVPLKRAATPEDIAGAVAFFCSSDADYITGQALTCGRWVRDGLTMNSHVIDSRYLGDLFGTEELRRVFSDIAQLQSWLDFEAALARAEAAVGLVPAEAAAEITRVAHAELIDLDALHEGVNFTGHPLISLVRQVTDLCDGEAGRYVHWGATTQDVTDTGLMLQAKARPRHHPARICAVLPPPWPIWRAASTTR